MDINFPVFLFAAAVPLVIGFIWYHPKTFGHAWMKSAGVSPEAGKGANMLLIFGLTYLLSFMASFAIYFMVCHQAHVYSIFADTPGIKDPQSDISKYYADFMNRFGNNFRTFKHGAFHGILSAVFFVLPVFALNAMFERKGFTYIAINVGFWILCLALMGGIICQFA